MTDLELGWAAGFYEGEGYCRARKGGGGFEITVGQNESAPLLKLRLLFGGSVSEDKWRVERVKKLNLNHSATFFWWRIGGNAARKFLIAIYPYISSMHKRSQIDAALAVPLANRKWARDPERLQAMIDAVTHMEPHKRYGEEIKELAKQFGVTPKTIYNIREKYFVEG